jgi:hypothetical protein
MNGITSPRPRPRSRLGLFVAAAALLILAATVGIGERSGASAGSQPTFLLPWQDGQAWLTGGAGFHGTNDAIDFFPPDTPLGGSVKCEGDPDWVYQESSYYVLAPASGEVISAGAAMVLIDHDDGLRGRGGRLCAGGAAAGAAVDAGVLLQRPAQPLLDIGAER